MLWDYIYAAFGGATAALGVAYFLFRKVIESKIKKDINKHASSLKIEEMKYQSQIEALSKERAIVKSNFLNKKIDALEKVYSQLVNIKLNFPRLGPEHSKAYIKNLETEEQINQVIDGLNCLILHLINGLDKCIETRKKLLELSIYFPNEIEKEIELGLDEYCKIVDEKCDYLTSLRDNLEKGQVKYLYNLREIRNDIASALANTLNKLNSMTVELIRKEIDCNFE